MKPRNHRIYWLVSIGIVTILCVYFGQQYSKLRSVEHHLPLVAISIAPGQDWLSTRVVEYELSRRIENGDFRGADVLSDTLIMGLSRDDMRPAAIRRAEWLVENLVDVNSEMTGGQPPLFAAIIGNDPRAVEQLIRLGADLTIKVLVGSPDDGGFDAVEYAKMARALFPDRDMTAIFELLSIDSGTD
jgi:hypothetical protein